MDHENPKVMAMMMDMMKNKDVQNMMQDPSALQGMMEHMNTLSGNMSIGDLQNSTWKNEELIRVHNEHRTRILQMMGSHESMFTTTPSLDVAKHKTKKSKQSLWKSALPISIAKLSLDTTHHGRVLRGTLIVDPAVYTAVQSLIQDDAGDVRNISFYSDAIKSCESFPEKWMMAHAQFPKGAKVAVLEPYYKVAIDMTHALRVDNMADVRFLDPLSDVSSALDLKKQANQLFSAHHFEDAKIEYTRAIAFNPLIEMYQTIFQNLSFVHLKQNQLSSVIQYGAAAIVCGSGSVKAYFRMAIALDRLGYFQLALCCCEHIKQCKDAEYRRLYSDLKQKCKGQLGNFDVLLPWEDMDMIRLLSTDVPLAEQQHTLVQEEDPLQLKQKGNDCVGSSAFEEAQFYYEKAFLVLEAKNEVPIATLLANCSSCSIQLGDFKTAMLEATIAVLLKATYAKAHYRRILSLISLVFPAEAKKAFDFAQRALGSENAICLEPLKPRLAAKPVTKRDSVALDVEKDDDAPVGSVALCNMLVDLCGEKAKEAGLANRHVAPFHRMYAEENNWPAQTNVEECQRALQTAYELARSGGIRLHLLKVENDPRYLSKRIGTNDMEEVKRFFNLEMGEVYFRKRPMYGSGKIHHNFGNVAQPPQRFEAGRTHVSIGFADLQELCIGWVLGKSVSPVNWVGYDQSPFVIAKTMVLIEMMQQSNCDPVSVIQVWYSAAWSHKTLTNFRRALTSVVNRFVPSCEEDEVEVYLNCWQQHTITLKMARTGWLETHPKHSWSCMIANWNNKSDQLAMCTYALTGQLFTADVGSVVMYALPNGEGSVAPDENVFHVICIRELLKKLDDRNCANCIDAATSILTDRVGKLMKRMQSGLIRARVKLGSISKENVALMGEIRALSPWSMSWSNVCDYITPTDFHYIARHCSGPSDTMHFGYSMNWTMETMGTSILDYPIVARKDMLEMAETGLCRTLLEHYPPEYQKYLVIPPNTNPINVSDFSLTIVYYEKWFEKFMEADVFGPHQGLCQKTDYSAFYSTSNITTFNFTYDPDIIMDPRR